MSKRDKAGEKGGNRARVEALEARLARIEALLAGQAPMAAPSAGDEVADPADPGGRLRLELRGGPGDWRHDRTVADLRGADWTGAAGLLASLGHPMRLAILQQALDGPVAVAGLQAGSTGQLYHHLRELTAAGWLQPEGRGRYGLPPDRIGPLLALLALTLAP